MRFVLDLPSPPPGSELAIGTNRAPDRKSGDSRDRKPGDPDRSDPRVEDRTLTAVCRIADGREQSTSLTDVNRCVGDIGNDNGSLTCSHGQPMAPFREDRR